MNFQSAAIRKIIKKVINLVYGIITGASLTKLTLHYHVMTHFSRKTVSSAASATGPFLRKSELSYHEVTHRGIKTVFSCDQCDRFVHHFIRVEYPPGPKHQVPIFFIYFIGLSKERPILDHHAKSSHS